MLTPHFIMVQPDTDIGFQDNIYIMTTCSTAAPILSQSWSVHYSGQVNQKRGGGVRFLILPCLSSRVHPTENLLFTGNVLILFLPQVTSGFLPGKLSVIHEIHVGLASWDFSRDFVCSLTHSPNEAMSFGFINFLSCCYRHNLVGSSASLPACH